MPFLIRPFERRDRDQLTALANRHVAAVIPGVVLSVNTVLAQLEREPGEAIVDPWVAERRCLVVVQEHAIIAAALVHRFRDDADVGPGYRGTADVRWLLCDPEEDAAGRALLTTVLELARHWNARAVGAECALPALACYGIADTLPHLDALLDGAGFGPPIRSEVVLVARCADLVRPLPTGVTRTLGVLGPRFTVGALGFVEVCDQSADMARSSVGVRWADVGNLVVHDVADLPVLLAVAADWLLLGGVERLVEYWSAEDDTADMLTALRTAGFRDLVTNERGALTRPRDAAATNAGGGSPALTPGAAG